MHRSRVLLWFVLTLFSTCGCKSQPQGFHEIQLIPIDTLSFPVSYDQYYTPWGIQYVEEHDSSFILLHDPFTTSIRRYHYPTGEALSPVPLQILKNRPNTIWSYFYQNQDSIYVLMEAANFHKERHDSALVRINDKGKVQEFLSLTRTPLPSSKNVDIPFEERYILWDFALAFHYPYVHISLRRETQYIGMADESYSPHDRLVGGSIDIRDKTYPFIPHLINWPDMEGQVFPSGSNQPQRTVTPEGKIVAGKKYLSEMYVLDPTTQVQHAFSAPSVVGETVYPLNVSFPVDLSSIPNSDPSQIRYYGLTYHPWWDCYIRYVQYPIKEVQTASAAASPKRGLIFLDKEFDLLGECLLPDQYGGFTPVPEGLGIWNLRKTGDMIDSFELVIFTYRRLAGDAADYTARALPKPPQKKPGGWAGYLSDLANVDSLPEHSVVLFVPVDRGCQGCLDYMIDLFMEEAQAHNEANHTPVKAILASAAPALLERKLDGHDLSPNTPGVYLDTEGTYQEYVAHSFRQGQLLLWEGGKVAGIVEANPSQLRQLRKYIRDHLQKGQSTR